MNLAQSLLSLPKSESACEPTHDYGQAITELLRKRGPKSMADIARGVGITYEHARRLMRTLDHQGKVQRLHTELWGHASYTGHFQLDPAMSARKAHAARVGLAKRRVKF